MRQQIPNRVYQPTYQCQLCGHTAQGSGTHRKVTPGSGWIELLLWLLFFPVGIIYSVWRLTARYKNGCPACGEGRMWAVGGYVPYRREGE